MLERTNKRLEILIARKADIEMRIKEAEEKKCSEAVAAAAAATATAKAVVEEQITEATL